jgi:hypothetical protein
MAINEKAAQGANRAASRTAFNSRDSTTQRLPYWLMNFATTAACVVSLAAPMIAALPGCNRRGRMK